MGVLFADHLQRLQSGTASALAAEGFSSLVVHAGRPALAFLDDQPVSWRPNPHFGWWAPLDDAPDSLIHVRPGRRPRLIFVAPRDYWHAPPQLPREPWVGQFEVVEVTDADAALAELGDVGDAALIAPEFPGREALACRAVNPSSLLVRLHDLRTRKTAWEQHLMRVANHRAARGHVRAEQAFHAGEDELGIQRAFLEGAGARELELPYGAIVATGERAAILHYQHLARDGRRPGDPRPSLLIDAGVQHRGYASDVTRTHAAGPGDFAALIGRMEELQQALCAAVRPGVDWRDLHQTAHVLLAEVLRDAGIVRVDAGEALDRGLTRLFLPHGLGHLLGLQVHDVGGFQSSPDAPPIPPPDGHPHLRLTRVLEPGFVVTMEPGLYFIDALLERARHGPHADALDWQRIESLRPCGGIRIEDDLLVTPDGCENLTRDAFRAARA